jgi:predicted nuclease of restriction endonuclease-like (RecB) superfamily
MTRKKAHRSSKPEKIRHALRGGFYRSVAEILQNARRNAYRAVNFAMVEAYWQIGRMIIEEEQHGKRRAGYGEALMRSLSERLTRDFGRGFNVSNLWAFKQFYAAFPILRTLCGESSGIRPMERNARNAKPAPSTLGPLRRELTWSHYRLLIRVEKPEAREWYMKEAAEQDWSVRALERQIHSLYYERLRASRDKKPLVKEMKKKIAPLADRPHDFIKDPYVLEFLGLKEIPAFRESDLEQAIIGKLQSFLLELGRGFAFVARQERVRTETKDFFIDLVFYNYILKCFVLVDLKTGDLTHQDIGQMDMYVRLYEDKRKAPDDNPTIGIILCTEKDATVVKYSVLQENKRLFAAKYRVYLPTEQELIEEIEREKAMIVREQGVLYGV